VLLVMMAEIVGTFLIAVSSIVLVVHFTPFLISHIHSLSFIVSVYW
jgi:hypothetical protein